MLGEVILNAVGPHAFQDPSQPPVGVGVLHGPLHHFGGLDLAADPQADAKTTAAGLRMSTVSSG